MKHFLLGSLLTPWGDLVDTAILVALVLASVVVFVVASAALAWSVLFQD
jgi:hypothetical protein